MAWTITRGDVIYIGWKENGKDRYATTRDKEHSGTDPKWAEQKRLEKELQQTVAAGPVSMPQEDMTLDTLIELYKKEADISESTLRINGYSWKKFQDIEGKLKLGEITTAIMKHFKDTLIKADASPTSICIYLRDLNKLLGFAVDKNLVRWNPCKKPGSRKWAIEHPEEELTWRFLTAQEEEKLLSSCNPLLARMVVVALGTGLRISQVVGMDWKRFDAKSRLYFVPKQKRQKARNIPVFDAVAKAMGPLHLSGRVFPGTNTDQITKMFIRAVRRSMMGGECTFHDLRHTFVSRVCQYLSPVEVRDLMGWSSVALVDRYTHSRVTDIQDKMREAMGEAAHPREGKYALS